jgi:hypothetical protein
MAIHGARIEIKPDLERFEDGYYDFLTIKFEGLPITVRSFSVLAVPGKPDRMFMLVNSVEDEQIKTRKQYCLMIDTGKLEAWECESDE